MIGGLIMYSISREQSVVASVALAGVAAFGATGAIALPQPQKAFSWTGFYIGGESVYGKTDNQFSHPVISGSSDTSFGGMGITGGYNYQFLPMWVAGIQGYYDWNAFSGDPSTINGVIVRAQSNWQSGFEGRLGFLIVPQAMVFATVGYQWKNEEIVLGTADAKTIGQVFFGGGFEYAITPFVHLVSELTVSQKSNDALFFGDLHGTFHDVTAKTGIDLELNKWGRHR